MYIDIFNNNKFSSLYISYIKIKEKDKIWHYPDFLRYFQWVKNIQLSFACIYICQIQKPCLSSNSEYQRKYFLPRIFTVVDSKKDGLIDFEEFLSAVALFRVGSIEDKIKGCWFWFRFTHFYLSHCLFSNLLDVRTEQEWFANKVDLIVSKVNSIDFISN
jgi:hypothetical protein